MATIKVTGVDKGTVEFVSIRAKSLHFKGTAEYLRNLIREDMARAELELRRGRLATILAPLHEHAEKQGYSDEELAEVFERARTQVALKRKSSATPPKA